MSTGSDVPWPSDFEVWVRQDLAEIRSHQARQDKLLMEIQLNLIRLAVLAYLEQQTDVSL